MPDPQAWAQLTPAQRDAYAAFAAILDGTVGAEPGTERRDVEPDKGRRQQVPDRAVGGDGPREVVIVDELPDDGSACGAQGDEFAAVAEISAEGAGDAIQQFGFGDPVGRGAGAVSMYEAAQAQG